MDSYEERVSVKHNTYHHFQMFKGTVSRDCRPALAHESVDPGVLFDEKNRGQKSLDTLPLKHYIYRSVRRLKRHVIFIPY
jgi:hypothetical protein